MELGKRRLLMISYPYLVVLQLFFIFYGDYFPGEIVGVLFLIFEVLQAIVGLAAFIIIVMWMLENYKEKTDSRVLLRINKEIKVYYIPAYIFLGILAVISIVSMDSSGSSWALALFWFMMSGVAIFLSGVIGLFAIIRAFQAGRVTIAEAALFGLLQFIYIFDVITSFYLLRASSKAAKNKNIKVNV